MVALTLSAFAQSTPPASAPTPTRIIPTPLLPPEAKINLTVAGNTLTTLSTAIVPTGLRTCPSSGVARCIATVETVAGVVAPLGESLTQIGSVDQPDSNFKVLAHPILSLAPHITAGHGISQKEVDALNALDDNLSHASSLINAFAISINRAQGAQLAGNSMWEAKQSQAARQFAGQAATLLRAEPRLLSNMQDAFKGTEAGSLLKMLTNPLLTITTLQPAQLLEQFAAANY